MSTQQFTITSETAGAVLGALRKHVENLPWSAARKHMEGRRISVNGILCVDSRVDLEAAVAAMGGGGPAAAVAVALGVVAVAAVAENQLVVAGGTLGVVLLALATRKKKTLARL